MYENSDGQVLSESDFQDVRAEVSKLAANWQSLGSALGLSRAAINEITVACRGNPSRCLDGVIERWLNQDYNWERFGVPSWSKLVDAVESRSGGKDPALAKKIRLARVSTEQSAMSAPQAVQTNKQAGDQVLDEGDFQQVRRELASYTSHWQSLALALGVSDAAISEIDMAYRGDPSRCLDGLIERWLKQNYDYSQFGLPSWNKVRVAVKSLGSERDPIAAVVKKPGPAHNNGTSAEQSGVPLHQAVRVERSEVQVNQTAQSTLRTSGITNGMVQTHIGPTEMPTAHLPVRSNQQALNKFPLQVMSSDELTSISQVVPSVAYPKKHSNIHAEELLSHPVEPLGPNVLQAETTHLPASSGQAQVPSTKSTNATLQTHNPPIPSARSHDPLIPSAKSHDPPIPLAESHDPPVPSVRSHDASAGSPVPLVPSPRSHYSPAPAAESYDLRVVSLARSHDPPVPLSESHDPSVSSVRPRDLPVPSARSHVLPVPSVRPLVLSAGSHNTPVPLARSPDSPLRSLRTHDPPVPLARLHKASEESHDPPVSSVGSHDLPVPSVRSHDASARSHDPPVLSGGSHDTPVPLARSPDSPVRLARSHDPPIPLASLHKASEGSHDPPVPSARSHDPPVPSARSHDPPVSSVGSHDLPVPSVRSHYAPVPSARSRGASAKSHDPTLPLGSPKLTIDPVVPSASSHMTSEPMVLPAKAPADPTLAYAAPTVPSHATPVARYSSHATEPLDFLPVQTTTKEKSKTSPIVQTQRRVEYAIGLKALQNDLARLDGKWFSIGVLLNISVHELGKIDSKSNELLDLKNVLVRWLSTTPTPMKSDLVEMLRSNAIDRHDLATHLKRHQDIPDTRPLVIDDFEVLLDLLSPLSKRWEDIAIQLDVSMRQLPSSSLESISSSNAIMLRMMLQRLQNVSPPPTLHDLIQALSSPVIGETAYAEELRQKYCSGGSRSARDVLLFPQDAADIRVEMDYTSNIKSIHSEAQASPSPASPICVHSDTVSSMEMTSPPLHVKSTDTESTVSIIAGGIIKREENESNILSSSAMSTFGVSNKFCVPVVSAEPSLAQQNTSIAPASISSSTPSISGLASDRWCEKDSQPIDSNLPDQATGVPLNSSTSMELNAGIIKTEENESNLSLSSSAMSTFGLMSNKFCVPAVSAEPSLAQQNTSIAPASIPSSTPSISGLASDRWCEKGSQPIDSNLPDQARGVPLNSSTYRELNAGIIKTEEDESNILSSSAMSTFGLMSNKFYVPVVSAEPSLAQQNTSIAPASTSSPTQSINGLASDRWCEKGSQPIDSKPPDQARGVPLNSSMSMELNAGIIKTEENESNLSLSSSAMSTFGLMSNKFCVPAVSAEPSLAQQNISIAPASISSSTPSISGLASDRWCEKGSQPIDSHLPDQATGVPLNSSTSMELNAVYANLAVGAGSVQDKLEKTGDTYKQLEVNESSSSIGQNSNAWAEKPISAQPSLDQQTIRQLSGLQSRANNAGNGFHNTQEALSMSSSAALSLTSGPSSDRWCAITRQTTDPAPKLSDQSYHLEVASDVIGSYNTADNMGVQNRMATVKDENESMAGASSVDTSQEFRGPSSSKLYSADLLPNEQERVANLENEEESMQHLSVQNTDSLSFSDPGRFYGTNIQTAEAAVANLPSDQGLGKEAEDILTQKEQRSIASVEEV